MNFSSYNKPHNYQTGGIAQKSGLHMVKKGAMIIQPHHAKKLLVQDTDAAMPNTLQRAGPVTVAKVNAKQKNPFFG